jgi:LysR family transcriptional regulator, transcriptional activator of the cysJI operon
MPVLPREKELFRLDILCGALVWSRSCFLCYPVAFLGDTMILDKKMQVFLVVAELESFSQAARRLSMSQSAVSFHVHGLEEELGVALFRRQGRTIALTAEGAYLSREGAGLAQGARRLRDNLSELSSVIERRIQLAGDAMMCAFTFPWALLEFRGVVSDAELAYQHLPRDILVEKLLAGTLDLGLTGYPIRHRKLKSQICFSSPVALVGAANADLPLTNLKELSAVPLLWCVADEGLELLLTQRLTEGGVLPKDLSIQVEIDALSLLKTTLEAGLGFAFLPELCVANELRAGILKSIPIPGFALEQTTFLLGRKEEYRPIVQRFWTFVGERRARESAAL